MWQSALIVIGAALALVIGHGWGFIAIGGLTVERSKSPFLFGMVLALAWLILLIGVILLVTEA